MDTPCYCTLLRKATRRVSGAYDEVLAPFGINIAQFALLRMVARRGPLSLTELGRMAELDRSTVGRNVRVLERMSLMKTVRSDDDQREAIVTLSETGKQVLDQSTPVWEACQRKIEERLGQERVEALNDILRTI